MKVQSICIEQEQGKPGRNTHGFRKDESENEIKKKLRDCTYKFCKARAELWTSGAVGMTGGVRWPMGWPQRSLMKFIDEEVAWDGKTGLRKMTVYFKRRSHALIWKADRMVRNT
jgi:hypothetical protein